MARPNKQQTPRVKTVQDRPLFRGPNTTETEAEKKAKKKRIRARLKKGEGPLDILM